ncbi:cell division protein Fic [Spirochaetia bacterium]|nr:cell division protein Fic [Spirochaetia bacterium]
MREFDYSVLPNGLFCNESLNLVSAVREFRGKQDLYVDTQPMVLTHLLEIAKIQSTGSSNRIEGIYTSDERLAALVAMKTTPRNRSEEEIAGYREVLTLIHENFDHIPPRPPVILQMHRDLYQFNPSVRGGTFKATDNLIAETGGNGVERIRFRPLSAFESPEALERICTALDGALSRSTYDPLLLIPMFILDFLCIHPFTDGNGRMSRLLTLLLLYRSGYLVGKYISLELIIEQTKESYYEALEASSLGWREGENDYFPFVRYFLEVLLKAYREFASRLSLSMNRELSKSERVRFLFSESLRPLSKADILTRLPGVSASTVEAALSLLVKEAYIIKTGAGKKTAYIRNMERIDTLE